MISQDEKWRIIKIFRIHPEGGMNVCTKFYGNPSNSSKFYLLININLMAALEQKSRGNQSH